MRLLRFLLFLPRAPHTTKQVGDAMFTCPARTTARALASGDPKHGPFLYFFNHTLAALQALDP